MLNQNQWDPRWVCESIKYKVWEFIHPSKYDGDITSLNYSTSEPLIEALRASAGKPKANPKGCMSVIILSMLWFRSQGNVVQSFKTSFLQAYRFRKLFIPCAVSHVSISNALGDLGASISLMPCSICKPLQVGELKPNTISTQLANRSIKYLEGC